MKNKFYQIVFLLLLTKFTNAQCPTVPAYATVITTDVNVNSNFTGGKYVAINPGSALNWTNATTTLTLQANDTLYIGANVQVSLTIFGTLPSGATVINCSNNASNNFKTVSTVVSPAVPITITNYGTWKGSHMTLDASVLNNYGTILLASGVVTLNNSSTANLLGGSTTTTSTWNVNSSNVNIAAGATFAPTAVNGTSNSAMNVSGTWNTGSDVSWNTGTFVVNASGVINSSTHNFTLTSLNPVNNGTWIMNELIPATVTFTNNATLNYADIQTPASGPIDITLTNNWYTKITNKGWASASNNSSQTVINNGLMDAGSLDIRGILITNNRLMATGQLNVYQSFTNNGKAVFVGQVIVQAGGTFVNDCSFTTGSQSTINGSFTNNGYYWQSAPAPLFIYQGTSGTNTGYLRLGGIQVYHNFNNTSGNLYIYAGGVCTSTKALANGGNFTGGSVYNPGMTTAVCAFGTQYGFSFVQAATVTAVVNTGMANLNDTTAALAIGGYNCTNLSLCGVASVPTVTTTSSLICQGSSFALSANPSVIEPTHTAIWSVTSGNANVAGNTATVTALGSVNAQYNLQAGCTLSPGTLTLPQADFGNLPVSWPIASATTMATNRAWLGIVAATSDCANTNIADPADGLSIYQNTPGDISGSGTQASPWQLSGTGGNYHFTVTVNGDGASKPVYWAIWYDADGDGSFTGANDMFFKGNLNHGSPVTTPPTSFTVPQGSGATSGVIRVIGVATDPTFTQAMNGTGAFINGEVEDFYLSYIAPLPVTLTNFTATLSNCSATLNWQTANELNSKTYQIQQSADGVNFVQAASVASKNDAAGSSYSYKVSSLFAGINYFRLKAVDADGKFTYSNITSVRSNCKGSITITPNPTSDIINIAGLSGTNSISIVNAIGVQMATVQSSSFAQPISLAKFADGVYIIRIVDAKGNITNTKVVKK